MSLPLIDPFVPEPYQNWSMRPKTPEEIAADYQKTGRMTLETRDQLLDEVWTPLDAARYMAREAADNGLGNFINNALSSSAAHKEWRDAMPPRTPAAIVKYQQEFRAHDAAAVDAEINARGVYLPVGQILYHGGLWMGGASNNFTTTGPLSTTLCPQVALREAEHQGKAYNAGEIHLLALRVLSPSAKAFVFRRGGTGLGHENEVLFASGLRLLFRSKELIRSDYPASNFGFPDKQIPAYVFGVDLS